jgi:hypothetical protein
MGLSGGDRSGALEGCVCRPVSPDCSTSLQRTSLSSNKSPVTSSFVLATNSHTELLEFCGAPALCPAPC